MPQPGDRVGQAGTHWELPTLITTEVAKESRNGTVPEDPIEGLRRMFPWPGERPDIQGPVESPGWLGEGTEQILARSLSDETRLVVELGAWLGMSTRFIADLAPNATVISIDHWRGSPEHQAGPSFQSMLATLYETFLMLCWPYRDQVIPLRMSTLEGLRMVASRGLEPDLIYVDAEHSYEAVTAELELARELFPRAQLVGADYDRRGVQDAVECFARRQGLVVDRAGARGWRLIEASSDSTSGVRSPGKNRSVVLVPFMNAIEPACENGLRELEQAGVTVRRRPGCSGIDVARNEMVSEALHDGFDSMLFIDSDIGFATTDALRLLAAPEPVVAGIYVKKGPREVASTFAEGVKNVVFGPDAPGLYQLKYAATGFLRIRAEVLRQMIERLQLPLCNTVWGRGIWPFFQPLVVPQDEGRFHYLGEDWAFSYRLAQIGVTPLADTTFRLHHFGPYSYSWEEAGSEHPRYQTYNLKVG